MRARALLCCLLLAIASPARAAPTVLAESRMVPDGTLTVGSTARLEVDVLVDTWFTAEPQLPPLELPGALVMPPSTEATHLTVQRDGRTLFGLRFSYLITPEEAREYQLPALTIQVSPGQADAPVAVATRPLSFLSRLPPGAPAGQRLLVAQSVSVEQHVKRSRPTLQVGDSLTLQLVIEARGAQAMLIPPPAFGEVDGLRRYLRTPQVTPLDNGRGAFTGGRRVDTVSYVVDRPGDFQLPAIELPWWDATANQLRQASVPAVTFKAVANASYQAPFSVAEDLRQLGRHTRLHIEQHWLLLLGSLLLGAAGLYWGYPWWARGRRAIGQWRQARQNAYLQSARWAWQQIPGQLRGTPARLDALYLWARRATGVRTLADLASKLSGPMAQRLLAFLNARFGSRAVGSAPSELMQALPELARECRARQEHAGVRYGLQPLNPRQGSRPVMEKTDR